MKATSPSMGSTDLLEAQQDCTQLTANGQRKSRRKRNLDIKVPPPFEQQGNDTSCINGVVTLIEYTLEHLLERTVTEKDAQEYHMSSTMQHRIGNSKFSAELANH